MVMSLGSRTAEQTKVLQQLGTSRRVLRDLRVSVDGYYEYDEEAVRDYNQLLKRRVDAVQGYIQAANDLGIGRSIAVQKAQRELAQVYRH